MALAWVALTSAKSIGPILDQTLLSFVFERNS